MIIFAARKIETFQFSGCLSETQVNVNESN